VFGSALIAVALPLQLSGVLGPTLPLLVWLPVGVFEISLALWLIIKGVRTPAKRAA
jgi:hypothetical protein